MLITVINKTKNKKMSIFPHHIHFSQPDPLANGLGDEIAAEQQEAEAINSLEDTSAEDLDAFWTRVVSEARKDPSWFDFSNE